MRWQLNTKMIEKKTRKQENNLLRNENWGVCQNITKFMSGVDGCKGSGDVAKCESSLSTVNEAFNSASDLLSFIDNGGISGVSRGTFFQGHRIVALTTVRATI